MAHDVLLSYSKSDKNTALAILAKLEALTPPIEAHIPDLVRTVSRLLAPPTPVAGTEAPPEVQSYFYIVRGARSYGPNDYAKTFTGGHPGFMELTPDVSLSDWLDECRRYAATRKSGPESSLE